MEIMKILGFGAHPDDIEIYMFGLLSEFKKSGHDIFLGIATDGCSGNVLGFSNIIKTRKTETLRALRPLAKPVFFDFSDGRLSYQTDAGLTLKNFIDKLKPDLVITHSPEDYHPDHRALSDFLSRGSSFYAPIIYADTLMGVNFIPEYYVDITSHMKMKERAILEHHSQQPKKFVEATRILNRFRSAQCNYPENNYAEAYRFDKKFPFVDIRNMLPNNIKIKPYYKSLPDSLI